MSNLNILTMEVNLNISKIGVSETDSSEEKLQKAFLTYLAIFMSAGGIVWGTIALLYKLPLQASIPLSYTLISAINLIYFYKSKNFRVVRAVQVFISLMLPFIFQWSLGGYLSSGIISLWSLLALVAALSFSKTESAYWWLLLFVVLTVFSGVFDKTFQLYKPEILNDSSILFLVLNISLISTIVFRLVSYFVQVQRKTNLDLSTKQVELELANKSIRKTHQKLKHSNLQLQLSKAELLEITERQMKINEQLLSRS